MGARPAASAELIRRAERFIREHRMLPAGGTVLVAVSGGPDSMVLLHLLRSIAPARRLSVRVAHLHHGLRGREADRDLAFVRDFCRANGIRFASARADAAARARARGLSIEEAAREMRYAFLRRAAARAGAAVVALGHTADDQVETFLLRLLRGAGWRGLAAMRPVRVEGGLRYVRPLLGTWRSEVLAHAAAHRIPYRIDRSNMDVSFLRNRIRRRLIPLLRRDYNPGIAEVLRRCAAVSADGSAFIEARAARILGRASRRAGAIVLRRDRFLAEPGVVRAALLVRALAELGAAGEPDAADVGAVEGLCRGRGGYRVRLLPGGAAAAREHAHLVLSRGRLAGSPAYEFPLEDGARLDRPPLRVRFRAAALPAGRVRRLRRRRTTLAETWGGGAGPRRPLVEHVSLDATGGRPLVVRSRRPGDRYRPLGAPGGRTLKKIMIDGKLPLPLRRLVPVIACGDRIVWFPGAPIADEFKVTPATRGVLRLAVERRGRM
ncbi:MAG: tRNA lysidine(34) synthetase TilS [bacterium]|nr:tRNA lysidine(34) synthetase TilS [bacterium]